MNPEALLLLLLPLYGVPALWLGSWIARRGSAEGGAPPTDESEAWRALWAPLWGPGLLALVIGGWGLEELVEWVLPEPAAGAITLAPVAALLSIPLLLLIVRALVRAGVSLFGGPRDLPAAITLGLLRPRALLHPVFEAGLDPAEREAALAHERAHVLHRDPLRIWLAQLATDLQWPSRGAAERFKVWRETLELARDAEARNAGANGVSLAAAILAAARFANHRGLRLRNPLAVAGIEDSGPTLRRRIDLLLTSPVRNDGPPRGSAWFRVRLLALGLAGTLGFFFGEICFKLLPGVRF